jgi:phosphonoacetate hydrolase
MASTEPAPRPTDSPVTDEHRAAVDRAEAALLDPSMSAVVEMVLRPVDDDVYEAASIDGRVQVRRTDDGRGWRFEELAVEGRNPLADQSTDRFAPLADERATPYPTRDDNAYPNAYEQLAQLFDHPAAPDLVAVHTAGHNWEDHGGHRGEHGSLDVVQARAPFVIAGAGVRPLGMVPESCRLVDIAPTVLALMGAEPGAGWALNGAEHDEAFLARQDGVVLGHLIDPGQRAPDHVVGFLLDGTNANVLYDMAARGEAPNVARLMAMGTTMGHGAMSSLPTVTLPNHTTILTGVYPGHHGILHNAWWDRAQQTQLVTNSPATWVTSMETLFPGVETIHHAVKRAFPGSTSYSINEPCDAGADYSIFDLMRRGEPIDRPPPADDLPNASQMFVRPVKEYRWSSLVDHTSVDQFVGLWGGHYRGTEWPLPRFTWVNFTLTDAAFHEGGPYSEIAAASVHDTDARIGEVLAAVERAGVFDRTAFFVVADHGMEETDPSCTGNWADALEASGVPHRDEAYGFVYVNP